AGAKAKCQTYEDEILTAMATADDQTAQIPVAEQSAKKAHEDAAAFEREQGERLGRLNEQLKAALAELKTAEESLHADIRLLYSRMVASYGADALAEVKNRTCSFCHTEITHQQAHELATGQFVSCKSCYRGLYLAEE